MRYGLLKKIIAAFAAVSITVATPAALAVADDTQSSTDLESLRQQLTDLLVDIDELESRSIELRTQIDDNEAKLVVLRKQRDEDYKNMKLRIEYMYENQRSDLMSSFLSSKNMSEALNEIEYFQRIYDYDRTALDKLDKTVKEIEDVNTQIAQENENILRDQEEYMQRKTELDTLIENAELEEEQLQQELAAAQKEAKEIVETRQAQEQSSDTQVADAAGNSGTQTNSNASTTSSTTQRSTPSYEEEDDDDDDYDYEDDDDDDDDDSGSSYSGGSGGHSGILASAQNYLGVPYVYGGSSPSGFDCSGLVQYVYAQNGISIPRTSYDQEDVGYGVSLSEASVGDIVCYSGHVAIYAGGGQVIHAPYPGESVQYASVNMMPIITIRHVE